MPVWVIILMVVTGTVPHDSGAYRIILALEIFLLGWGVGLGRAALATNRGEGRGTPIAGLVLNTLFFVLLAMIAAQPPPIPQLPTTPTVESQKGRASDQ